MTSGTLVLAAGVLLAAAVAASLVAARLRLPALLLFLILGMVAGSDGAGLISFDNYTLAREIGMGALALILFDGGLRAGFSEIKQVLGASLRLAVVGTVIVAIVTAVVAVTLFRLDPLQGLLLGAIVASTDSAAVFSLLRGSTLSRRLVQTLEGEAGFNDPVALVLVLGFMEWIRRSDYGLIDMTVLAVRELVIGAAIGYLAARLAVIALSRLRLPSQGLYPVASLAVAGLAYGAAASLQGSGFLAVYLAGLLIGDAPIACRNTIAVFHDGVAWVAQIGVFLTLGLLVFPSRLGAVAPEGVAVALVVVLIARPLGTVVALARQGFTLREQAVLSWAGMRGAAPVVFATLPVAGGIPGSQGLFDVVFLTIVVSTVLQGMTFEPLARRLGLTSPQQPEPGSLEAFDGSRRPGSDLVEYRVTTVDAVVGRRLRDLDLPPGFMLVMIVRGFSAGPPVGSLRLNAGDRLQFLVRDEVADRVPELLDRLRGTWSGRTPSGRPGAKRQWDARSLGGPVVVKRVAAAFRRQATVKRTQRRARAR
ncbi:MAG: potassium/proton antiporter [Marmoricola sp.]|nr:potassium/proton antiporter [Marmoricola sp.]